jgi:hypothetical protein
VPHSKNYILGKYAVFTGSALVLSYFQEVTNGLIIDKYWPHNMPGLVSKSICFCLCVVGARQWWRAR